MNLVRPVHDHDFADVVLGSAIPVVVGFTASWPGGDDALDPMLDELAAGNDRVGVVRLDVDAAPRTASAYGITTVPSVLVFNRGQMVLALPGIPTPLTILSMLRVALPAEPSPADPV